MPRRPPPTRNRYDDFGQAAKDFGQAARETVSSLDVEWAHRPPVTYVREACLRFILDPIMTIYTRRKVEGTENLRGLSGPIIFVANHASHMDTPAILRALPRRWRRRTVVAAAADYFYRSRFLALAVSVLFNTVPIDRRSGRNGNGAKTMTPIDRMLARGNSLLLFPEGTRNRTGAVGRLRLGAAKMATRHHAKIVPIYIHGSGAPLPPGRFLPRRRHRGLDPRRHIVTITIGKPIDPGGEDRVVAVTERIAGFFEQARVRQQAVQNGERLKAARRRIARR